jgi:hypothetical protein
VIAAGQEAGEARLKASIAAVAQRAPQARAAARVGGALAAAVLEAAVVVEEGVADAADSQFWLPVGHVIDGGSYD